MAEKDQEKIKLLLVEDDENLGTVLHEFFVFKGYQITLCQNGEDAMRAFFDQPFDICVMDVMMPKMDGFTLAKNIRKANSEIPIIFLTARSMKEDKIEGFKLGGDDYITKPFSMEELELRIEAVIRRTKGVEDKDDDRQVFKIGKYTFSPRVQMLRFGDDELRLTTKESGLMKLLCVHENKVLEREVALKTIWGNDSYFTGRSMDVFITKLRKYLKGDPSIEIMNIHGTGYKLLVHDN